MVTKERIKKLYRIDGIDCYNMIIEFHADITRVGSLFVPTTLELLSEEDRGVEIIRILNEELIKLGIYKNDNSNPGIMLLKIKYETVKVEENND